MLNNRQLEGELKMQRVKDTLMALVLFVMLYIVMVIMFILDGAPFHQ
jgi:hypothetical protein